MPENDAAFDEDAALHELLGALGQDSTKTKALLALSVALVRPGRQPGRIVLRVRRGRMMELLTIDDLRAAIERFRAS